MVPEVQVRGASTRFTIQREDSTKFTVHDSIVKASRLIDRCNGKIVQDQSHYKGEQRVQNESWTGCYLDGPERGTSWNKLQQNKLEQAVSACSRLFLF